jgi:uncharacterized protein (DUF2267 family)
MSTAQLDVLDRIVEKANIWINEVAAELDGGDRHEAYRVLRAFLHTLRDRLPVEQAALLAAQLPLLIRGIFYEGWQPRRTPLHYRDPVEFVERVRREALLSGDTEASFAAPSERGRARRRPADIAGVAAAAAHRLTPITHRCSSLARHALRVCRSACRGPTDEGAPRERHDVASTDTERGGTLFLAARNALAVLRTGPMQTTR